MIITVSGKQVIIDDEMVDKIEGYNWYLHPVKSGQTYLRGYRGSRCDGLFYLHRIITDADKNSEVDHINGNGLDNRLDNLRVADRTINNLNRSNVRGCYFEPRTNTWRAEICFRGIRHRLGRFKIQAEAIAAYNEKKMVFLYGAVCTDLKDQTFNNLAHFERMGDE